MGEDAYMISHSPITEVTPSYSETKLVDERRIKCIDTQVFFDTCGSNKSLKADILRCITECAPGPHAFLIVLKVEQFTEQENEVIKKIREYFSEEAYEYATCFFTHGDKLQKGLTIDKFVSKNIDLSDLVKKCGGRCHVVDNKYWKNNEGDDYRSNQFQVARLLNTVDQMIEANNGCYYTNEMLQKVKTEIQREEERVTQFPNNMSQEEIITKAKIEKFTEQEKEVIKKIDEYFSEKAYEYATCVFTHGDQLQKGSTIEEFVSKNIDLSDLVKKCGGRCHVVDNKYWKNNEGDDYRSNQFQVARLLNTVDQMIEANNGCYYTNEMLEKVKTDIQREEERIRQSPNNMSQEEIITKAKRYEAAEGSETASEAVDKTVKALKK
ncbi:hypothetical protein NQZ68_038796 [Dissostichus eleginoides]|nr:hypothetical protein NQZ68_038796 [Dissostichus eleginoides]